MDAVDRLRALVTEAKASGNSVFSNTWLTREAWVIRARDISDMAGLSLDGFIGRKVALKETRAVGGDVFVQIELSAINKHGKEHAALWNVPTYNAILIFHGVAEGRAEVKSVELMVNVPVLKKDGSVASATEKSLVDVKGETINSKWFKKAFNPLFDSIRLKASEIEADDTGWDYES
jgi:hypothetical protein